MCVMSEPAEHGGHCLVLSCFVGFTTRTEGPHGAGGACGEPDAADVTTTHKAIATALPTLHVTLGRQTARMICEEGQLTPRGAHVKKHEMGQIC